MSRFNPHFPNAAEVFDAADKFKQRCLLDQESLFLDGQTLWTAEHFQALIDNYVKQPDVGDGGFCDKLKGGARQGIYRLTHAAFCCVC